MNIAFYSGASGMRAFQSDMDSIAHNIANVNTTGYKPSRSIFGDLLYSRMAVNTEEEFLTGHGVKVTSQDLIFRQGAVISTEYETDFGIIGSGFFGVMDGEGNIEYTRNGAFHISVEEGNLVTSDGWYVLGIDGEPIELERNSTDSGYDLENIVNQLGVYQFNNPFGLAKASGGRYLATEHSGEAIEPDDYIDENSPFRIVQNALERSAVEVSDEMVMVIQSQRAFQFSARLVQTADQLEEIVNNLR